MKRIATLHEWLKFPQELRRFADIGNERHYYVEKVTKFKPKSPKAHGAHKNNKA